MRLERSTIVHIDSRPIYNSLNVESNSKNLFKSELPLRCESIENTSVYLLTCRAVPSFVNLFRSTILL